MSKRRFELRDGKSDKFWEIEVQGDELVVRFGRPGSAGQQKVKRHSSADVAEREAAKLVREKTGKGYREVGAAAPQSAASLGDLLAELEAWLTLHRKDVLDSLGPPATSADLARLEAGLKRNGFPKGVALPDELRTLLSWHAGQTGGVGDADEFFRGRKLMQIDWMIDSHEIMLDHARDNDEDPGHYNRGWIGVLDNGYSILCVDAAGTFGSAPGNVVFVDFKGGESRAFEAPSLTAWFERFVGLLRHPRATKAFTSDWDTDEDHQEDLEFVDELEAELGSKLFPGYPIPHTVHDPADVASARKKARRDEGQLIFIKLEKRDGRTTFRWECDVDGATLDERLIVIGKSGTTATHFCATEEEAAAMAERFKQARLAQGYHE